MGESNVAKLRGTCLYAFSSRATTPNVSSTVGGTPLVGERANQAWLGLGLGLGFGSGLGLEIGLGSGSAGSGLGLELAESARQAGEARHLVLRDLKVEIRCLLRARLRLRLRAVRLRLRLGLRRPDAWHAWLGPGMGSGLGLEDQAHACSSRFGLG